MLKIACGADLETAKNFLKQNRERVLVYFCFRFSLTCSSGSYRLI